MDKKNAPASQSTKTQNHYISLADALTAFRDAIARSLGSAPDDLLTDQITRWDDPQGKRGNKACYCQLFTNGRPAGYFGNWRTSHYETWFFGGRSSMTQAEYSRFKKQMDEAKSQRMAEQEQQRQQAAGKARHIWQKSHAAPADHPYLMKKRISAGLARVYNGALVLPVGGFDDQLYSLQFINLDGSKKFLSGGKKKGCYIPVQMPESASKTLICEGWATGQTLAEMEPAARVLAAMDAGNLEPVAIAARKQWTESKLIICGDDDRASEENKGRKSARQAAIASGSVACFPTFPPDAPLHLSDFNDLVCWMKEGA